MRIIYGGHWTETPLGWTSILEEQQDLTKPLHWSDGCIDAIFTEHVAEHLEMLSCISFFKEAHRVLKPGGILRTVAPFIDQMVRFAKQQQDEIELHRNYAATSLAPYYMNEALALMDMEIKFSDNALPFFFDSLLKKHNHRFVWSSSLMAEVLTKIGFSDVRICLPGESELDQDTCLERVMRGINREKFRNIGYFDPESLAVEARK